MLRSQLRIKDPGDFVLPGLPYAVARRDPVARLRSRLRQGSGGPPQLQRRLAGGRARGAPSRVMRLDNPTRISLSAGLHDGTVCTATRVSDRTLARPDERFRAAQQARCLGRRGKTLANSFMSHTELSPFSGTCCLPSTISRNKSAARRCFLKAGVLRAFLDGVQTTPGIVPGQ
jgi:hypothetical protein